jgi:AraC-like DNA-binding protein
MTCATCYARTRKDDKFCATCGTFLDQHVERHFQRVVDQSLAKAERRWLKKYGSVAALFLGVLGFIGFRQLSDIRNAVELASKTQVEAFNKRVDAQLAAYESRLSQQLNSREGQALGDADRDIGQLRASLQEARDDVRQLRQQSSMIAQEFQRADMRKAELRLQGPDSRVTVVAQPGLVPGIAGLTFPVGYVLPGSTSMLNADGTLKLYDTGLSDRIAKSDDWLSLMSIAPNSPTAAEILKGLASSANSICTSDPNITGFGPLMISTLTQPSPCNATNATPAVLSIKKDE